MAATTTVRAEELQAPKLLLRKPNSDEAEEMLLSEFLLLREGGKRAWGVAARAASDASCLFSLELDAGDAPRLKMVTPGYPQRRWMLQETTLLQAMLQRLLTESGFPQQGAQTIDIHCEGATFFYLFNPDGVVTPAQAAQVLAWGDGALRPFAQGMRFVGGVAKYHDLRCATLELRFASREALPAF